MESTVKNKNIRKIITIISIVLPLAVAALFVIKIDGVDLSFLPKIYAGINALTAVLLILALVFVKQRKLKLHENVIKICMVLSILFLLCYVAYHMTSDSTKYGNPDATARLTYFLLLITHIVLSVAVIPMVLFSYLHAWEGNFEKHKKLTKITWPIWFYVAVSGVIVYLMISPYYGTN
jgi:putative membrane protein